MKEIAFTFPNILRAGFLVSFLILSFASGGNPSLAGIRRGTAGKSADGIWHQVDESTLKPDGERRIVPIQYRTLALNLPALEELLELAPQAFSAEAQNRAELISLPLPEGGYGRFRFVEAPIMAPVLGEKFPRIKTYLGWGIDDPGASVRFDVTPSGFHAMILSSKSTVYIDPYRTGDQHHYISYFKRDYFSAKAQSFQEFGPLGEPGEVQALVEQLRTQSVTSDGNLRTYRAAIAATGEYTQFHGGTKQDGIAAIVTTLNRVVGIYERDVAVRMELVSDNDEVVYTDGAADPYTNEDGVAMLSQNQATLDSVIGSANYDIGHVFSTGGGGVASIGVPCRSLLKARGVTGLPEPVGDPFNVDYVAHEMGHQFGANHSFNGDEKACAGGNRYSSTAYEPGSGSTIMAYAGICGSQNLQIHSDDYFHGVGLDEIIAYTTLGSGNSCPTITATGNSAPIVSAGEGGFTIPAGTPFALSGSAMDDDGDELTYTWEQFDLGPAGHPDFPSETAPIFRSFKPVSVPMRTFPRLQDLLNGTHTIGELLPTYSRSLTFRLTVRDNHVFPAGGRIGFDTISFDVTDAAGPFLVTTPNTFVTWRAGAAEIVTWEVANTADPPVNCPFVDILLSIDGGYTYPLTLVEGTPNDGSEGLEVPDVVTWEARIKLACANSIFFDVSDVNFMVIGDVYLPLILR